MDNITMQELSIVINKLADTNGANPPILTDNARHTEMQALFDPSALRSKSQKSLMMDLQILAEAIKTNNPTVSFLNHSVEAIKPKFVAIEDDEDCFL